MSIQVHEIKETGEIFQLVVSVDETTYEVTVAQEYWKELTGGKVDIEVLVRDTFEFLLLREPKEAILSSFDISVVQKYFPEYEKKMKDTYAAH